MGTNNNIAILNIAILNSLLYFRVLKFRVLKTAHPLGMPFLIKVMCQKLLGDQGIAFTAQTIDDRTSITRQHFKITISR